jgi:hypothetical protein
MNMVTLALTEEIDDDEDALGLEDVVHEFEE